MNSYPNRDNFDYQKDYYKNEASMPFAEVT